MNQEITETIAKKRSILRGDGFAVFWLLLGRLQFGNEPVYISQVDLGEVLQMRPENVARALKKLVSAGLLIKTGTKNRPLFRIPPTTAWRGSGKAHVVAIRNWQKSTATITRDSRTITGDSREM
jgi:hypothetical protein